MWQSKWHFRDLIKIYGELCLFGSLNLQSYCLRTFKTENGEKKYFKIYVSTRALTQELVISTSINTPQVAKKMKKKKFIDLMIMNRFSGFTFTKNTKTHKSKCHGYQIWPWSRVTVIDRDSCGQWLHISNVYSQYYVTAQMTRYRQHELIERYLDRWMACFIISYYLNKKIYTNFCME